MQRFTIIGSGNVATWFAWMIRRNGGKIVQVCSQNRQHAEMLAAECKAQEISQLNELNSESELYIFAVKDDAYSTLVGQLPFILPHAVHTAGSVSQEIFKGYAHHYGVLYPYQSISKSMDFENLAVPLCVEGNCRESEEKLITLAQKWQIQYYPLQAEQRAILHLAATFASNFTNALYGIAFELLHAKGISEDIIFPLLDNTLEKIKKMSPCEAQTGPAVRNDKKTMNKHLEMIENQEFMRTVYRLFSGYIQAQRDTR